MKKFTVGLPILRRAQEDRQTNELKGERNQNE